MSKDVFLADAERVLHFVEVDVVAQRCLGIVQDAHIKVFKVVAIEPMDLSEFARSELRERFIHSD